MEKAATDSYAIGNIGAYRIVRPLGHGGMGTVYEVEDAAGAHLALKLFTGGAKNQEFLEKRFRAEAKILAMLDHPHLVKVRDVGVDEATGNPWFTMDLVLNAEGDPETLEDARRRGGISNVQALCWFRELADELDYLHARGIVHRDVKLENVLIDDGGHAVLSDFGISRIFDDRLRIRLDVTTTFIDGQTTGTRPVMGTYFYLAPEVRAGQPVTPASDWYALGVLFFRLLTGMWYESPKTPTEANVRKATSPFDMLLAFDPFWQTNLPRLLSDDPKMRTIVGVKHGTSRRRWMFLLGLGTLAAGVLIAVRTGSENVGDCFALREVRFGKGLIDVGQAAFGGCSNLMHVYFAGDAPVARGTRIYVRTPTNLVNHVQPTAKGWRTTWPPNDAFARKVEVGHSTTDNPND